MEADLGAGPVWRIESQVSRPSALPAIAAIREVLEAARLEAGRQQCAGGSDLGPLRALGVPVLDLSQDATTISTSTTR